MDADLANNSAGWQWVAGSGADAAPWETPAFVLADAGLGLGETYPLPIVDRREARERALDIYRTVIREGA